MAHDYRRNGTATLYAALETLEGKVGGESRHRHFASPGSPCISARAELSARAGQSQQAASRGTGIVAAQSFQLAPKGGTAQRIEQRLDGRVVQMLAVNRQVVALRRDRDEVQPEHPCCRTRGDTAVPVAGEHAPCGGKMSGRGRL